MDTVLRGSFPLELQSSSDKGSPESDYRDPFSPNINKVSYTKVEIDPLQLSFSIEYDSEDPYSGEITAELTHGQFNRFLRESTGGQEIGRNGYYREAIPVSADKVVEEPEDEPETESNSLRIRTTPTAVTWLSDNVVCKVYRSSKIEVEEVEKERRLDENRDRKMTDVLDGFDLQGNQDLNRSSHHALQEMCIDAELNRGLSTILSRSRREQLSETQYGKRAIRHIREADYCFELDLFLPALASYIQSIEWVIIAYLAMEKGEDLIINEQDSDHKKDYYEYYEVVSELGKHTDIDQTTVSRLKSLNEQRRWMDHHKSGEIRAGDIQNVRHGLLALLEYLFN